MNEQEIRAEIEKLDQKMATLRSALPDPDIEATLARMAQRKNELLAQLPGASQGGPQATVTGGGAVAQGPGAAAVGERGVYIGGSASGPIVTGDSNQVIQAGRDVTQGVSGAELAALFKTVYQQIEARPPDPNVDKEEIVREVQTIEKEAGQAQPNENKLERWIRNLVSMAPDIVDVMTASLAGPVAGGTAVLKKVIDRVRQGNKAQDKK